MKTVKRMILVVSIFIISGCSSVNLLDLGAPKSNVGESLHSSEIGLQGAHYAKLNSIGCRNCPDMEKAASANRSGDFDAIDNLIREKRCFVVPTDTDIFISERVKGEIVSAKLKGSAELFYTLRSNLAFK